MHKKTLLPALINIYNYIANKGYDIFPEKQEDGNYKVIVWKHDTLIRKGKTSYKFYKTK